VYAVGEDGPGRRLGHGVVVDHPTPHHVTVESAFGTKRAAAISHVSLSDASPVETKPPGHTTTAETPAQKWAALCDAVDERITTDPHWPPSLRSSNAPPLPPGPRRWNSGIPACSRPRTTRRKISRPRVALTAPLLQPAPTEAVRAGPNERGLAMTKRLRSRTDVEATHDPRSDTTVSLLRGLRQQISAQCSTYRRPPACSALGGRSPTNSSVLTSGQPQ
jgi:hypothetical protein